MILRFFVLLLLFCSQFAFCAEETKPVLVGWGLPGKNIDDFLAKAQEVGFDVIISGSHNADFLRKAVAIAKKHNIKLFSCITPMGTVAGAWKKRHKGENPPWQKMSPDEDAAFKFITAGNNKYHMEYQWGGEPLLTNEVLFTKIICFNNDECFEMLKQIIDEIASVEGLEGIAFDGFGYQNYHSCDCPVCVKALADHIKAHPGMDPKKATQDYYRNLLVAYINKLAAHARLKNKNIKTAIHLWPVFAPEPLYGNRLDVDYCGQTAAWYTLWPKDKIEKYSVVISEEAKKYHNRQEGVGMIGYYDRPGKFPVKSPEVVDMELKTMLSNGCRRIQVCGARDVIANKPVAAVFKKYFKHGK